MGTRTRGLVTTAINIAAVPESEKDEKIAYVSQYTCKPPPLFLPLISILEVAIFIWHVTALTAMGTTVDFNGPPLIFWKNGSRIVANESLHYDPNKIKDRVEIWRYITYALVHSGYSHIILNIVIQIFIGIPLEMVHQWWRIIPIYFGGIIAGSLASTVFDPNALLVGCSAGVYALIYAHLGNVVMNWAEMRYAVLRTVGLTLFTIMDTANAIYYRYNYEPGQPKISFTGHIAGAIGGFLMGVLVLRNLRFVKWEGIVWWVLFSINILYFSVGVIVNLAILS